MKRFLLSVTLLLSLWAWGQEEAPQVSRLQDWGGFFSIGYEGGSIAPYGIRAESARVDRWIGGFLIARTSFHSRQKLEQVSREDFPANKTEFIGGANFRLVYWAYLNIGGGIGQHYYPFEHGSNHQRSLEKDLSTRVSGSDFSADTPMEPHRGNVLYSYYRKALCTRIYPRNYL